MGKRITHKEFEKKAIEKHGAEKYKFLSNYIKTDIKIHIECLTCGDEFWQTPENHLQGQNCPKCGRKNSSKKRSDTLVNFKTKAINIHGNSYEYLSEYINNHTKIKIKCLSCNNIFLQIPNSHLNGRGCPPCGNTKKTKTNEQFLLEARNIHGNRFNYLTEYTKNNKNIHIECLICNTKFFQRANSHIQGHGCANCNGGVGGYSETFFKNRPYLKIIPAKLYLYKFWNEIEEFYKIGITINNKRYFDHGGSYNTLLIGDKKMTLYDAFLEETSIIELFKEYKYLPQIKFKGSTECFNKDVLKHLELSVQ